MFRRFVYRLTERRYTFCTHCGQTNNETVTNPHKVYTDLVECMEAFCVMRLFYFFSYIFLQRSKHTLTVSKCAVGIISRAYDLFWVLQRQPKKNDGERIKISVWLHQSIAVQWLSKQYIDCNESSITCTEQLCFPIVTAFWLNNKFR